MFSSSRDFFIIAVLAVIGGLAVALPRFDGVGTGNATGSGTATTSQEQSESEPVAPAATGVEAVEETTASEAVAPDNAPENVTENATEGETANEAGAEPVAEEAPEVAEAEAEPVIIPEVDTMRFDGAQGVVSGTAAPNSEIVIMDGETQVARAKTDGKGKFALTFDYDTPAEGAILQLAERNKAGDLVAAEEALTVLPQAGGETATANLTADGVEVDAPRAQTLALGQMSYGSNIPWVLSGTSAPDANVDITINGNKLASVKADDKGNWNYQGEGLEPGNYTLGLSENGGAPITQDITLQADLPEKSLAKNNPEATDAGASASNQNTSGDGSASGNASAKTITVGEREYVVQRGDSLWRIAERYYGEGQGDRYTEIFDMNSSQIRNPDLIYPDQEFEIPEN